ncbi:radical SAM family heme chaperone HemW [Virgibacillus xinjiangensis]|uniref:Heme chaperone HemW n=1 Tax=Virgibacillus xinjiangensis TaxID=393090 RepID=A0ABV7CRR5_9BACI
MDQVKSAYIHIPFCSQICYYCDFVKFMYKENRATEYLEALEKEMDHYLPGDQHELETIFIGGGTPTALNREQLGALFRLIHRKFNVPNLKEFSIEVNPGDLDDEKARILRENGVDRISFGVQVMDDDFLKQLGRLHRVKDVYDTVDILTRNRLTNISLDLIYGLPNQSVDHFRRSLNEALAFDLPHYSTYALQVEPKTVFYQRRKKGQLTLPAEEEEVRMYQLLRKTMQKHGKQQYEISNFAQPGYESKHNLTYWKNEHYFGFGAGAHGYLPGERTANLGALPAYIKQSKQDGNPVVQREEIGLRERIEEEMFLGLRKADGIDKADFARKFGFPLEELYGQAIKRMANKGLMAETQNGLQLTDDGLLLANRVFEEFMLSPTDLELVN